MPTTRRLVNHWDESYFLQLALVILSLKATVRAKPGSEVIRQIVLEPLNATESMMTHFIAFGVGYDFFSILSYPISIDINNPIWDAQYDAHGKEDE